MKMISIEKELKENSYPGRGIIVGLSEDGTKAVIAYFIMGRSSNSRNRIFVEDGEGIRTQAFDPSKLEDPSLIIYAPVRVLGNKTIVTNGDQTDTIYDGMDKQLTFEQSLRSREFEPDVTNSAIKTATTTPGSKPSGLGSLLGDAAAGGIGGHMYASSVSKGGNFANNVIGSVATGSISQMGSISGKKAAEALHSYMGYAALESGAENIPTFQNVEIGGGRITGTEVTEEHPEGISFGMYHADQYVAPEGQYTTVHAVDGTAWYKQYAVDAVDKSPYMAPDGSIAFNESIVKKLPPAPRRKDKI